MPKKKIKTNWNYHSGPDLLTALERATVQIGFEGNGLPEDFTNRKERHRAIKAAAGALNKLTTPAGLAVGSNPALWKKYKNPRAGKRKPAPDDYGAVSTIAISKVLFHLYRLTRYPDVPLDEVQEILESISMIDATTKVLPRADIMRAVYELQKESRFSSHVERQKPEPFPEALKRRKPIRWRDGE